MSTLRHPQFIFAIAIMLAAALSSLARADDAVKTAPKTQRGLRLFDDATNDDMPYDRFLMEQIAGDLLPADDWHQRERQPCRRCF